MVICGYSTDALSSWNTPDTRGHRLEANRNIPLPKNTLARRPGMVCSGVVQIHHEPSSHPVPSAKFRRPEPLSPLRFIILPSNFSLLPPLSPPRPPLSPVAVPPMTPPAKSKFLSEKRPPSEMMKSALKSLALALAGLIALPSLSCALPPLVKVTIFNGSMTPSSNNAETSSSFLSRSLASRNSGGGSAESQAAATFSSSGRLGSLRCAREFGFREIPRQQSNQRSGKGWANWVRYRQIHDHRDAEDRRATQTRIGQSASRCGESRALNHVG